MKVYSLYLKIIVLSLLCLIQKSFAQTICTPENREALEGIIKEILAIEKLEDSFSQRNVQIGTIFLNTAYVEKTLEITDDESLVINVLGLDCTTFVESVIALNRSKDLLKHGIGPFENSLTFVRYRNGVRDGYPSRLHYFSDWISDAVAKGFLMEVTKDLGGVPYENKPTFMSENPQYYPQLSNPYNLNTMRIIEQAIAKRQYHYIPKAAVKGMESKLQNGDLIAITSSLGNLDMVHVGFAVEKNGRMHLLHASSASKKVEISEKPIHEYLQGSKSQSGIMVGRFRP